MAKTGSTAKPARVNIQIKDYLPAGEQPELPFKMLVMGDYTQKPDDTEVADRERVQIDKDTFSDVMKKSKLSMEFSVKNQLGGGDEQIPVKLKVESLKDFRPEAIVEQVPQLQKLLAVRNAVKALRNPMSSKKDFVKQLTAILKDGDLVQKIVDKVSPTDQGGTA